MELHRLTISDRFFAWFSLSLVLITWGLTIWAWPDLPREIPTHFGPNGLPDAWGTKSFWSVWFIPILQLGVNGLFVWIYRYPQYSNIPSTIAITALPEPVRTRMFQLIRRMIAILSVILNLMFAQIMLTVISVSFGLSDGFHPGLMLGLIGLLLYVIIRTTVIGYRLAKAAVNQDRSLPPVSK